MSRANTVEIILEKVEKSKKRSVRILKLHPKLRPSLLSRIDEKKSAYNDNSAHSFILCGYTRCWGIAVIEESVIAQAGFPSKKCHDIHV